MNIQLQYDQAAFNALVKEMTKLPGNFGRNAFRASLRKMIKIVKDAAAREIETSTDKGTGRLAGALSVKGVKKYEPVFFKQQAVIKPGKTRDDPKGAYYGWMVHNGHKVVIGKKKKDGAEEVKPKAFLSKAERQKTKAGGASEAFIPPNPFFERAAKSVESRVNNELVSTAKKELDRQWKKAFKKMGAK